VSDVELDDSTGSISRLQPGIAFQRDRRPAPCYRLLLLNAANGATPAAVHDGLVAIGEMLQRLVAGEVRELAGQPKDKAAASAELFAGLEHLIAFGLRLFDADMHEPMLIDAPRPDYLAYLLADGPFPALRWEQDRGVNPARPTSRCNSLVTDKRRSTARRSKSGSFSWTRHSRWSRSRRSTGLPAMMAMADWSSTTE
jgi:hypothetical protein